MQMVPGLSLKVGISDFCTAGLEFFDRRGICSYSVNESRFINFYTCTPDDGKPPYPPADKTGLVDLSTDGVLIKKNHDTCSARSYY